MEDICFSDTFSQENRKASDLSQNPDQNINSTRMHKTIPTILNKTGDPRTNDSGFLKVNMKRSTSDLYQDKEKVTRILKSKLEMDLDSGSDIKFFHNHTVSSISDNEVANPTRQLNSQSPKESNLESLPDGPLNQGISRQDIFEALNFNEQSNFNFNSILSKESEENGLNTQLLESLIESNDEELSVALNQLLSTIPNNGQELLSDNNILRSLLNNVQALNDLEALVPKLSRGKSFSTDSNDSLLQKTKLKSQNQISLPRGVENAANSLAKELNSLSNQELLEVMSDIITNEANQRKINLPLNLGIPLPASITNSLSSLNSNLPATVKNTNVIVGTQKGIPLPSLNTFPNFSKDVLGQSGIPLPALNTQGVNSRNTKVDNSPQILSPIGFVDDQNIITRITGGIPLPTIGPESVAPGFVTTANQQIGITLPEAYTTSGNNLGTPSAADNLQSINLHGLNTASQIGSSNPAKSTGIPLPTIHDMTLGELIQELGGQDNSNLLFGNELASQMQSTLGAGQTSSINLGLGNNLNENQKSSLAITPSSAGQSGIPLPGIPNSGVSISSGQAGLSGIPLPDLQGMTLGELMTKIIEINGLNSKPVINSGAIDTSLPTQSGLRIEVDTNSRENIVVPTPTQVISGGSGGQSGIPLPSIPGKQTSNNAISSGGNLRVEVENNSAEVNVILPDPTTTLRPTRRRRPSRRRTTKRPPDHIRKQLSDLWFSKGQWLGTVLGGLIDVGISVAEGIRKRSGESSRDSYSSHS